MMKNMRLVALLLLVTSSQVKATPVVDQEFKTVGTTPPSTTYRDIEVRIGTISGTVHKFAQTFTVGVSGFLTQVDLRLRRGSSYSQDQPPVDIKIVHVNPLNDASGKPAYDETPMATGSISAAALGSDFLGGPGQFPWNYDTSKMNAIPLESPVEVTAGEVLAIMISSEHQMTSNAIEYAMEGNWDGGYIDSNGDPLGDAWRWHWDNQDDYVDNIQRYQNSNFANGQFFFRTWVDSNYVPPSCTDGIQNQGETGVDCGGPCPTSCVQAALDDFKSNVDDAETILEEEEELSGLPGLTRKTDDSLAIVQEAVALFLESGDVDNLLKEFDKARGKIEAFLDQVHDKYVAGQITFQAHEVLNDLANIALGQIDELQALLTPASRNLRGRNDLKRY